VVRVEEYPSHWTCLVLDAEGIYVVYGWR